MARVSLKLNQQCPVRDGIAVLLVREARRSCGFTEFYATDLQRLRAIAQLGSNRSEPALALRMVRDA